MICFLKNTINDCLIVINICFYIKIIINNGIIILSDIYTYIRSGLVMEHIIKSNSYSVHYNIGFGSDSDRMLNC